MPRMDAHSPIPSFPQRHRPTLAFHKYLTSSASAKQRNLVFDGVNFELDVSYLSYFRVKQNLPFKSDMKCYCFGSFVE